LHKVHERVSGVLHLLPCSVVCDAILADEVL